MARFHPLHPSEDAVPPVDVRFLDLHVEPWGDNRRIRVHIRLTPFQKPPDLVTTLVDATGMEAASALIVENIDFDLVFTLHIRLPDAREPFELTSQIQYGDLGVVDQKSVRFTLPEL